jgi:hypothetical protein
VAAGPRPAQCTGDPTTVTCVPAADKKLLANSPFTVGVSGHRDLDPAELPRLREVVTGFVCELKEFLPDTDLRLIVGMAEGADLLVAQAALALGVDVEAVLPMPLEQYAADFDAETLSCLRELLRHPQVHCVELGGERPRDTAVPHNAAERDAMFAHLTTTLIRRSSLLLALWDGKVSQLPGGTADTVLRYLGVRTDDNPGAQAIEFSAAPDDADSEQLVYWTPTTRTTTGGGTETRPPCYLLGGGDTVLQVQRAMPTRLKHQLAELNAYNLEYRRLFEFGRVTPQDSLLTDLPEAIAPAHRRMLADIDAQYAKADALAVYYQRRSDRLFDLFGVMAFAMGLAYLIYEKLTESRMLLIAYLVTLLTSLTVYYVLQRQRWFGKHLTYRALAETLRARFYLRLAGADQHVDASEVLTLSGIDRFHGFGWIAFVIKGIEPPDIRTDAFTDADAPQLRHAEQAWIESQHAYFTRKVARLERASHRVKRLRQTLFVAILVVISVLFTFGESLHHIQMGHGVPLRNLLTFSMGALAVLLGVWELHQDKMAIRELLWQYRNQLTHFARARALLARMTTPARRNEVLAELGKDSLMESYLWAIHRYHREHEPPAVGGGS